MALPKPITLASTDVDRFWSIVGTIIPDANGCWPWPGVRNSDGYGHFSAKSHIYKPHRVMLALLTNSDLADTHALHTCDNPPCVAPDHVFGGSNADNIRDRNAKGRANRCVGSRHPYALLTEADVRAIRALRTQGLTYKAIGDVYGVHYVTVMDIVAGRSWKHVS